MVVEDVKEIALQIGHQESGPVAQVGRYLNRVIGPCAPLRLNPNVDGPNRMGWLRTGVPYGYSVRFTTALVGGMRHHMTAGIYQVELFQTVVPAAIDKYVSRFLHSALIE